MNACLFRDSRVVPVTERRPLEPSCMRLYIPVQVGGIPSRARRGAASLALTKKSRILESVMVKSTWFFKSVDEFSGDVRMRRGTVSLAFPE